MSGLSTVAIVALFAYCGLWNLPYDCMQALLHLFSPLLIRGQADCVDWEVWCHTTDLAHPQLSGCSIFNFCENGWGLVGHNVPRLMLCMLYATISDSVAKNRLFSSPISQDKIKYFGSKWHILNTAQPPAKKYTIIPQCVWLRESMTPIPSTQGENGLYECTLTLWGLLWSHFRAEVGQLRHIWFGSIQDRSCCSTFSH